MERSLILSECFEQKYFIGQPVPSPFQRRPGDQKSYKENENDEDDDIDFG
jgi:hypothetical protein